MTDPNDNLGLGGGPQPPLGGGSSLEDDEKALKKGSTGPLVIGLLAAVLVVGGLGYVLLSQGGGDSEQYGAIGRAINGMKQEHFDSFWACALPNQRLELLRSDQDLRAAINQRAGTNPRAYGEFVRTRCLSKLAEHGPLVRELIPPADLADQIDDLSTSISELNTGWNEYIAHLAAVQERYDEEAAAPSINKIAKGWYDYRTAHSALNHSIREHLDAH